ncbi:hypothetical protein [Dactylosporangium sp. CA-139066]|uniref:hypothetical protein n=1 Tax=Dactylosporangium sp. CA-139066 TaxID=3239930 RepID=UPI003D93E581
MPAPNILPDSGTLAQMRRTMTIKEIADEYGVSEVAVYKQLNAAGLTKARPPKSHPWTLKKEHEQTRPAIMLRALARRERGEELPAQKSRSLDIWLDELDRLKVVVDYDPDAGPNPASPIYGGFVYRERLDSDGESRIRYPNS